MVYLTSRNVMCRRVTQCNYWSNVINYTLRSNSLLCMGLFSKCTKNVNIWYYLNKIVFFLFFFFLFFFFFFFCVFFFFFFFFFFCCCCCCFFINLLYQSSVLHADRKFKFCTRNFVVCASFGNDSRRHNWLFGRSRPNNIVISQMWQLPLHFQAAPNIFTII